MRMLLNHSTADLMDIKFLALVAGNRKRSELEDMKNLWIWLFADLPTLPVWEVISQSHDLASKSHGELENHA